MASYAELEQLLEEASGRLDHAAKQIRDLGLNPPKNIRRLGDAIVLVAEIRNEVYALRPDLMPEYLRKR